VPLGLSCCFVDALGIGDIGRQNQSPAPESFDLASRRFEGLGSARNQT
jgi:hypothetical protein